jgi:DNA-binding response OmpR family regulator
MDAMTETLDWRPAILDRSSSVPDVLRVGASLIHRQTGRVETPTGQHRLRAKELELIVHLYENVTLTFSREKLLQLVWNYAPGLVTRTVDQTMATLRKKIELDPEQPRFLQTVYGIGYRLVL